jgi:hypothetical protein
MVAQIPLLVRRFDFFRRSLRHQSAAALVLRAPYLAEGGEVRAASEVCDRKRSVRRDDGFEGDAAEGEELFERERRRGNSIRGRHYYGCDMSDFVSWRGIKMEGNPQKRTKRRLCAVATCAFTFTLSSSTRNLQHTPQHGFRVRDLRPARLHVLVLGRCRWPSLRPMSRCARLRHQLVVHALPLLQSVPPVGRHYRTPSCLSEAPTTQDDGSGCGHLQHGLHRNGPVPISPRMRDSRLYRVGKQRPRNCQQEDSAKYDRILETTRHVRQHCFESRQRRSVHHCHHTHDTVGSLAG